MQTCINVCNTETYIYINSLIYLNSLIPCTTENLYQLEWKHQNHFGDTD